MRRSFVSLPRHFTSVSFSFSRACVYTSFDRLTHTHTRQIEHDAAMLTHWYRSYTYTVSTNWSYFLCLLFFFFFIFSDRFISITFEQTWIIYIYVIYMYVYILKKIQVAKLNRKQAPPPKILLIVSYMWDVCTSESIINWEEKKKKKKKRGRNKYK